MTSGLCRSLHGVVTGSLHGCLHDGGGGGARLLRSDSLDGDCGVVRCFCFVVILMLSS